MLSLTKPAALPIPTSSALELPYQAQGVWLGREELAGSHVAEKQQAPHRHSVILDSTQ